MRTAALLFTLALFCRPAHADVVVPSANLSNLNIDASASTLTYHVVHKLHRIDATSHKAEGKARILPDGQAQVAVRATVESFDSGNSNRDAHMKEVVEAARFPQVELKAAGTGVALPQSYPATVEKSFKAKLTFHGIEKQIDVPVKLTFESAGRIKAQAHFSVSLDEFKVERPSLLFVKVDDAMVIDANLVFKG